jgi:hypothetical protein
VPRDRPGNDRAIGVLIAINSALVALPLVLRELLEEHTWRVVAVSLAGVSLALLTAQVIGAMRTKRRAAVLLAGTDAAFFLALWTFVILTSEFLLLSFPSQQAHAPYPSTGIPKISPPPPVYVPPPAHTRPPAHVPPPAHAPPPASAAPPTTGPPSTTGAEPPDSVAPLGNPHPSEGRLGDVPLFPWPPPAASASEVLPHDFFVNAMDFEDINQLFIDALDKAGYAERSYYAVPRGFALVTRLEQIEDDGTPKDRPQRWSAEAPRPTIFSLQEYVKALFTANTGHYRVIVLVVTDVPFQQSSFHVDESEALNWLHTGLNVLPIPISRQRFSADVNCTALIYEFERAESSTRLLLPSRIDAHAHLTKAGLWRALSDRPSEVREIRLDSECDSAIELHIKRADGLDDYRYYLWFGGNHASFMVPSYDRSGIESIMVVRHDGKGPCSFTLTIESNKKGRLQWSGSFDRRRDHYLFRVGP